MARPVTLTRDISPPPPRRASKAQISNSSNLQEKRVDDLDPTSEYERNHAGPILAAIEAGEAQIRDHLAYFIKHLAEVARPSIGPRTSIDSFQNLYKRNQHSHGRHFVIHQHDHPISGVHYDLRLQFSESSSISFAVPYGMPGNPNSIRPNRMAIETRVHNLWNHLVESASPATGSLLIWDVGEYEVLPWRNPAVRMTDDEFSDTEKYSFPKDGRTNSERLFAAFQGRHVRLRLQGCRLPPNYTLSLRLSPADDRKEQPLKPKRKRRLAESTQRGKQVETMSSGSDSHDYERTQSGHPNEFEHKANNIDGAAGTASDDEENENVRENNAYTGSTNTIGSIHQQHWFLNLDRRRSGFHKARSGRWEGSWEPFFVHGREYEKSVVTGRSADDVMADEGVENFVGRKMWRPILE